MDLNQIPLHELRGISTAREKLFAGVQVHSVGELLCYYPRTYENRGNIKSIFETADGECAALILTVATPLTNARIQSNRSGRAMTVQHFAAADESGSVKITFFNRPFLKDTFTVGRKFRFYGTLTRTPRGIDMTSPTFEPVYENENLPALVPVYPLSSGLTQRLISDCVQQALTNYREQIAETLPASLLKRHGFPGRYEALKAIHGPTDTEQLALARRRLAFEELYDFHLKTARLGQQARAGKAYRIHYPDMRAFTSTLPFALTLAQKHAIQDILKDITGVTGQSGEQQMRAVFVRPARRLVQGDVGCGKTMVACAAIYAVAKSGYQAALMAPTGILARQHYEEIGQRLAPFGMKTVLLVGGMKLSEKREALTSIANGEANLVIGTHALIEENVIFQRLALAVTDEQHRFGVMQRRALEEKTPGSIKPHIVVMSATPIPRTLAMILYCDLDISIIDQLPAGRQPVNTYAVGEDKRMRVYTFIAKFVAAGRQAYILCPLAEAQDETEKTCSEMKAAREYCASLKDTPLADVRTAYIHGRMKPAEKEKIMTAFAAGEIDVLVSTTVIEVGVNVPNAAVMLIENAERFGLSQLHQLRGRVGRGSDKAYCILMSPFMKKNETDSTFAKRVGILCKSADGFEIAQKDLELRGPGEFFGVRQSGELGFRLADVSADMPLVLLAKAEAEQTLAAEDKSGEAL